MTELHTKRLVFDVEPRELVRLLRGHRKAKAGPFSWKLRQEGREVGLFLVIEKSDRDGFEGTVSTILYRMPGSGFLAKEGELVATLHGTRVRAGETLVLMKCPAPEVTGSVFVGFVQGMEALQKEVAKAVVGAQSETSTRPEEPQPRPRLIAASPESGEEVKAEAQEPETPTRVAKGDEPQPEVPTQEAEDKAQKLEGVTPEVKPWLQIPDVGWDRMAVRLVHQGYSSAEIARKIEKGIVPKTVENRLSALRAQYGPEIVPYRKKPTRNRDKPG